MLSGERKAEQRKHAVTRSMSAIQAKARHTPRVRRENVEESLREIEARRAKAKSVPLSLRIAHAGLNVSKRQFILFAGTLGIAAFVMFFLIGLPAALAAAFAASCGLPLWILNFLRKRREKKFIDGFPDAIDVIVRGIK